MTSCLVISIADANDALEVVEVGGSTIEVADHDDVVRPDSGESSCSGGVVKDDGDVALAIHLLELGSLESHGSCGREGGGGEANELVMEDDESVRVVEVAVGESRVDIHDVNVGRGCSVALFVEHKHESHVHSVRLSVMNIQLIHCLNGGDGDLSSNATGRTISNRDRVDGGQSPRGSSGETG